VSSIRSTPTSTTGTRTGSPLPGRERWSHRLARGDLTRGVVPPVGRRLLRLRHIRPNGLRNVVGQPGCTVPSDISAFGTDVTEGISPGWGDVYTWDTPDQYIDISSVPPGTYALVEETNPDGSLLVAGPTQTCAVTTLSLTASSVTPLGTSTT
jgi:hypothetical protein